MPQSLKGRLILAAPHLADGIFRRSVILMCEHGEEGALGVILNRPGDVDTSAAFPELDAPGNSENTLRCGGPVQPESVFILHDHPDLGGTEVLPGLWFGGDLEMMARLAAALREDSRSFRFRLYAGYAGWGRGQLEREQERHDWIGLPSTVDIPFEARGEETWARILEQQGGMLSLIARAPSDPSLN